MEYGFSSLGCPDKSIEQIVKMAQQYGYRVVSLRTVSGTADIPSLPEFSDTGLSDTAALFERHGVKLLCMASGVRFVSPDPDERKQQAEVGMRYIDIAHALGAPYVRVFGGPLDADMDISEAYVNIAEGMRILVEYAEKRDVFILIETHDSFATGKSIRSMLEATGLSGVYVVWDILHSLRCGESFESTWQEVGPYIKHVHLKDSEDFDENGFDIRLCGEGRVPIADAVSLLHREGYEGYYEFEWEKGWHREIPEAEVAFPHFISYMKTLEKAIAH